MLGNYILTQSFNLQYMYSIVSSSNALLSFSLSILDVRYIIVFMFQVC